MVVDCRGDDEGLQFLRPHSVVKESGLNKGVADVQEAQDADVLAALGPMLDAVIGQVLRVQGDQVVGSGRQLLSL